MKFTERISWLMRFAQRVLSPHLNQFLPTLPNNHEGLLPTILVILQAARHVPRIIAVIDIPGASLLTGRPWPVRS